MIKIHDNGITYARRHCGKYHNDVKMILVNGKNAKCASSRNHWRKDMYHGSGKFEDSQAMKGAAWKPYAGPNLIITPQKVDSACLSCAGCPHMETKDLESCGKLAVCLVDVHGEMWSGHWTAGFASATATEELAAALASLFPKASRPPSWTTFTRFPLGNLPYELPNLPKQNYWTLYSRKIIPF